MEKDVHIKSGKGRIHIQRRGRILCNQRLGRNAKVVNAKPNCRNCLAADGRIPNNKVDPDSVVIIDDLRMVVSEVLYLMALGRRSREHLILVGMARDVESKPADWWQQARDTPMRKLMEEWERQGMDAMTMREAQKATDYTQTVRPHMRRFA